VDENLVVTEKEKDFLKKKRNSSEIRSNEGVNKSLKECIR
jgi:hypothetical protein